MGSLWNLKMTGLWDSLQRQPEQKTFLWDHKQGRWKCHFYCRGETRSVSEVVTPMPAEFCSLGQEIQKGQNKNSQWRATVTTSGPASEVTGTRTLGLSGRRQESEVLMVITSGLRGGSGYATLSSNRSESRCNQLKALLVPWVCYVAQVWSVEPRVKTTEHCGHLPSKFQSSVLSSSSPRGEASTCMDGLHCSVTGWLLNLTSALSSLVNRKLLFLEACWIPPLRLPTLFLLPNHAFLTASCKDTIELLSASQATFPKFISAPASSHLLNPLPGPRLSPVTASELVPWLHLFPLLIHATRHYRSNFP